MESPLPSSYWVCNCRHPNTKVWYADALCKETPENLNSEEGYSSPESPLQACPHCDATPKERGRHAYQGYCEACNGEPTHLGHIALLRAENERLEGLYEIARENLNKAIAENEQLERLLAAAVEDYNQARAENDRLAQLAVDMEQETRHRLEAENTRLRQALRELVAWSDQNEPIHEAMRHAKELLDG